MIVSRRFLSNVRKQTPMVGSSLRALSTEGQHGSNIHRIAASNNIESQAPAVAALSAVDPAVFTDSLHQGFQKLYKQTYSGESEFEVDESKLTDLSMQLSLLQNKILPRHKVLDAGCGLGYMTAFQFSQPTDAHGVGKLYAIDRLSRKADLCARALGAQLPGTKVRVAENRVLQLSPEVLKHLVVVPSDASIEGNVGAPYDAIRTGFALRNVDSEEAKVLTKQLRRGGILVAPVGEPYERQQFVSFVKDDNFNISVTTHDYVLKKPVGGLIGGMDMTDYLHDPEEEQKRQQQENERLKEREAVQKQLLEWRTKFEAQHGRKPDRNDLIKDNMASGLFLKFSQLGNPVE